VRKVIAPGTRRFGNGVQPEQLALPKKQEESSLLDEELDETENCRLEATSTEKPSSLMHVSASNEFEDGNVGSKGSRNEDEEEGAPNGGSTTNSDQGFDQTTDGEEEISPVIQENQAASFRKVGYVLAVASVVLDTYGSLLTKMHGWNFTSWGISLIRFGCSGLLMAIVSVCLSLYYYRSNNGGNEEEIKKDPWYQLPSKTIRVWAQVCLGVVFVTFLCPALSNYALFQIPLAYALTLASITPLYALFLEWAFWGQSKRPTLRALLGSSMAVGGVVWLGILNAQADLR